MMTSTSDLRRRSHNLHGSTYAALTTSPKSLSSPSSSRPTSPFADPKRTTGTARFVVLSLLVICGIGSVIVWSSRTVGQSSQYVYSKRTRRRPSVFDSCRDPSRRKLGDAPLEVNQAPCAYFRPALLMAHSNERPTFEETNNVKWQVYGFQVANFGAEWDGPRLGLEDHVAETTTNDDDRYASLASYVESVSILAAPKCGSRSLYQLFLSKISMPAVPQSQRIMARTKYHTNTNRTVLPRRVGPVDARFVEELERRQQADGIVRVPSGGMWAPLWSLFQASPSLRRRRDIVVSITRDPIPRFVSSVAQLVSMRGTKRCDGCPEHLEPCLPPSSTDTNDPDPHQVLECIARSITVHGFWNEHLMPWVHFVRTPLAGHDVEVVVFPMEEMGTFMEEFGVVGGNTNNNGERRQMQGGGVRTGERRFGDTQTQAGTTTTEGLHLNQFDAKKRMTEQGEELRGLVYGMQGLVANQQLSEPLRVELCRLYAEDVDVMHYLGFQVGYC